AASPQAGTPDQTSCRRGSTRAPRTQVRLAAFLPGPRPPRLVTHTERPATQTATPIRGNPVPPRPRGRHDPLPDGRVKDAYGTGYAGRAPARSLTHPPDRRTRQLSGGREQTPAHPKQGNHGPKPPNERLRSPTDTGKAGTDAQSWGHGVAAVLRLDPTGVASGCISIHGPAGAKTRAS